MARKTIVVDDVMQAKSGKLIIATEKMSFSVPSVATDSSRARTVRVDVSAEGKAHVDDLLSKKDAELDKAQKAHDSAIAKAQADFEKAQKDAWKGVTALIEKLDGSKRKAKERLVESRENSGEQSQGEHDQNHY